MTDAPSVADPFGVPEEAAPLNPMQLAAKRVRLEREKKALTEQLGNVDEDLKEVRAQLQTLIEDGNFPEKSTVDGATVYLWRQVWASPAGGDHARLTEVLGKHDLEAYQPSTVNTQSLSAYVREEVKKAPVFNAEDGRVLTLEERARLVLPAELVDALNLFEKRDVRVNGA